MIESQKEDEILDLCRKKCKSIKVSKKSTKPVVRVPGSEMRKKFAILSVGPFKTSTTLPLATSV